jgi:dipeptidyl aminopeptidase/acylaminoacyl peptidase
MISALVFFLSLSAARPNSPEGFWKGEWTKGGQSISVSVAIVAKGSQLRAAFDSDDLQASGIPFRTVSVAGGAIRMELQGDETTTEFTGRVAQNQFAGTFKENGIDGSFRLTRVQSPPKLDEQEVVFENGNVKLGGTVIRVQSPGKRPAILFVHGSGPEGRWASKFLAEKFARKGFVSLIYDKRGVGGSTGDWQVSGLEDLARDAEAGIRLLKSLPSVDPSKVGIYGHSQGGSVEPLVAEKPGVVSFVIASSAVGIDPAECEQYSVENSIGVSDLPQSERADAKSFVKAIVDVAYRTKRRSELDAVSAKFKGRSWYFDPPAPSSSYWTLSGRMAGFQPANHWRSVSVPVLLVFGDHDLRVPPGPSIAAITDSLRLGHNHQVTVKIFAGADHTYTLVMASSKAGWPKKVRIYADVLVDWAHRVTAG